MKRILIVLMFAALLVATPSTASGDDLVPLDEAIPANTDTAKFAPVFDFDDDGCLPATGISKYGERNQGLPDDDPSDGCRRYFMRRSNTLHRYARVIQNGDVYEAHVYALYFEKDRNEFGDFAWAGHVHDWENVIVWTTNGVITHVCASAHGDCPPKAASSVPFIGEHPAIVYHLDDWDGPWSTHAFRFAESGDLETPENPYGEFVTPPIASWYELLGEGLSNVAMRDRLNQWSYGSAHLPIKDSGFVTNWLNHSEKRAPGYPDFAAQGPPLADDALFVVAEDARLGSLVGNVLASDPNGDDGLKYTIKGGNIGGAFEIDPATGAITVAAGLDYETQSSYSLSVEVDDGHEAHDAAEATITVDVTDISIEFVDDDASVFEADVEWLAARGITKGCNPPVNDHFCPDSNVTRGQMAAFLHRALDGIVEPIGLPIDFTDDDDSIFVADIAWLSATGITKGCTATEYCPDKPVTRGQMAAFLVRALGYTDDGGGDLFADDDDSIFESDIDKLATAGVTRGCNPPANHRFCPGSNVTRGQMAAFLHRALGLPDPPTKIGETAKVTLDHLHFTGTCDPSTNGEIYGFFHLDDHIAWDETEETHVSLPDGALMPFAGNPHRDPFLEKDFYYEPLTKLEILGRVWDADDPDWGDPDDWLATWYINLHLPLLYDTQINVWRSHSGDPGCAAWLAYHIEKIKDIYE